MKALIVFCEGSHDVGLLRRLLKKSGQFGTFDSPIHQYPAPLGGARGFLVKRIGQRSVEGKSISRLQGHDPPSLVYAAIRTGTHGLLLLYRLGGQDQSQASREFLKDLKETIAHGLRFAPSAVAPRNERDAGSIECWSVAFVIDADSAGVHGKLTRVREEFGDVLGDLSALAHGQFCPSASPTDPAVGFFALCAEAATTGTLDDIVAGLLRHSNHQELLTAAENFLRENAPEKCELLRGKDEISRRSKLLKAALTCVGQFDDPGANYAVFIEHSPRLDNIQLFLQPSCKALLDFLIQGMSI